MAWLYKRPGSANWWIGWRANGKQFLKSTEETEKAKAEKKLAEFEFLEKAKRDGKLTQAFVESITARPMQHKTLKAALDEWLLECEGATSPQTVKKYRSIANEITDFLKATEKGPLLGDVETEEIRGFLTFKRSYVSANTVNQNRKVLSIFFIRCLKNSLIKSNPVLPIKKFKAGQDEQTNRRALTMEELKTVFDKCPNDFWRYMVKAGFYSGMRMGDLITLRWGEIDFEQNAIQRITGKTKKRVKIPIAAPLRDILCRLKAQAGKVKASDYLWPEQAATYQRHGSNVFSNEFYDEVLTPAGLASPRSHQKQKKGRAAKRNYTGVSFHSLRHTFISFLKITGSNNAVAKELVGHSSDAVNNLYTHLPMETLAKAINQLPGVGA
ncbi:MAG: tyrosine-type recombinase/integrase [Limisphaerales bacterium]